jgi:hypothetical protein
MENVNLQEDSTTAQPVAKKRTRKKKREVVNDLKLYFNNDTREAIETYQKTSNIPERNELYVRVILPAFEKLVENLINIYKFTNTDNCNDIRNDCINFLFETIDKFDASRGTNSFSYFNVVAKNWLIIKSKQSMIKSKRYISVDDVKNVKEEDNKKIDEWRNAIEDNQADFMIFDKKIMRLLKDLSSKIHNENEKKCINSIIIVFENLDNIEIINKKAILVYMKEVSGLNSKQLTSTMQNIRKKYKKIISDYKSGVR